MLTARPAGQAARVPSRLPAGHAHPDPARLRVFDTLKPPRLSRRRRWSPHLRYHNHEPREARSPSTTGFSSRSPASNGRCRALARRRLAAFPYPDQRGPAASRSAAPTRARAQEAGRKILDHHSQPCLRPSHYCTAPCEIPGRPIRDLRPSGPAGQTLLARRRGTRSCGLALRRSCTGLLPARRLRRSGPARPRGPRPCSVVTPGRRGWHYGCCRPAWQRRSCRAESGKAPPCMRWRGLTRPRRARPASWLASLAPRAARRGQVPARADRSPGSSHVPGVAPGWCPFPTVKAFLLPPRAPRKALRPAISCFFVIHGGIHRKQAVIRISRRLSTGLFTACPQCYRV